MQDIAINDQYIVIKDPHIVTKWLDIVKMEEFIVIKGAGYCTKRGSILSLSSRTLLRRSRILSAGYCHKGSRILSQREQDIVTKGAGYCNK